MKYDDHRGHEVIHLNHKPRDEFDFNSVSSVPAESLQEIALRFTRQGRRVFPIGGVKPDGSLSKKPLVRGYHGDHPYKESDLLRMPWHRATHVGLSLYRGEVALDIDVKNGALGAEHLDELKDVFGHLPSTLTQRTLSGGWHLLFRANLPARIVGQLHLPDGRKTNIDVIHRSHRYLVLYDLAAFDERWDRLAALPKAWTRLLARTTIYLTRRSESGAPGISPFNPSESSIPQLIAEVELAVRDRNNTLNSNLFQAIISGYCTDKEVELFIEAARSAGLDIEEVQDTVASACSAGRLEWRTAGHWFNVVKDRSLQWGKRDQTRIIDAAVIIAMISVKTSKTTIGLSARDLAVKLGVSRNSASEILRFLRKEKLLRGQLRHGDEAARYTLLPVYRKKCDSHPWCLRTGGLSPFSPQELSRAALRAHPAFVKLGTGPRFPPSAVSVLAEIESGVKNVAQIRQNTGLNRKTVKDVLLKLESAGVVSNDDLGVVSLVDDVADSLGFWVKAMGVDDRVALLLEKYQGERNEYARRRKNIRSAERSVMDAREQRAKDGRG